MTFLHIQLTEIISISGFQFACLQLQKCRADIGVFSVDMAWQRVMEFQQERRLLISETEQYTRKPEQPTYSVAYKPISHTSPQLFFLFESRYLSVSTI